MRSLALAILLLAPAASGLAQSGATRALPREAVVANNTDRTLRELYLHAPGGDPGADRLGTAVLPPRATLRIPLARGGDCSVEVRAVLEDNEEIRRRQDLCRNPRIAFAETGPRREITLANDTDLLLRELYVWPAGTPGPGTDRLGTGTLAAGERQAVRLRGLAGCAFDLRAVFQDESEEARRGVDLCRVPMLTFGDAAAPRRSVQVTNRSRRSIRELYARAPGAPGWGPDRLGAEVVTPGGSLAVRLRGTPCVYDVRAVFDNDREALRPGQDLCATPALSFGLTEGSGELRRITLTNGYSRTINQVFVSGANQGEWSEDALGSRVLPAGGRQTVDVGHECRADLRIVFANGAAEERPDLDVCAVQSISLRPGWTVAEGVGTPGPETRPQPGRTLLHNAAAVPVAQLYADPPGGPRGTDRLGATVLGAGERLDFGPPETLPRSGAACPADVTAIFRDGRTLRLTGHDLCAGAELVLR